MHKKTVEGIKVTKNCDKFYSVEQVKFFSLIVTKVMLQ
jgi:hypothetical protein